MQAGAGLMIVHWAPDLVHGHNRWDEIICVLILLQLYSFLRFS
jgi:hypothetical protein